MDSIVQLKNIVFDNPQFSLTTTFERNDFTRILTGKFGIGHGVIDAFFNTVGQMNFYDDHAMTTGELFEQFFPGRSDVHRLLMEPITYANGSSLLDPAITYGIVFSNFMNKGVFTFQGGTDQLIGLMRDELIRNGVTICTNATVQRIVVEKGKVQGVYCNERFIGAPCVVSNGGVLNTVYDLVGKESFPEEFMDKAVAVRVSNSSCQVYMGIKEEETRPEIGDLLFTSKAEKYDTDELLDMHTRSKTFSIYYPKTRPGHNRYTVVASMNGRYEDWANLSEETYQREKEALINRTLDDLEKYIPQIRHKCDWLEAATPKTFKRYTLHTKGTSFGTKFEGLEISRSLFKVVPGLFHVGSVGIIMSGWLGAINYGVIVANDVDGYIRSS
jgi:phytoene dehydrogenase-like protein